jgi:hypothetical protein
VTSHSARSILPTNIVEHSHRQLKIDDEDDTGFGDDDSTLTSRPSKHSKLCRVDSETFYSVNNLTGVITLHDNPVFIDLTVSSDDES